MRELRAEKERVVAASTDEVEARTAGERESHDAYRFDALDAVITSKAITNRPKDLATLPILYALRDEIAGKHRRRAWARQTSLLSRPSQ